MTLEEAIERLQVAGLYARRRNNEIIGGTLIEAVELPPYGDKLLSIENEFWIIQEKQLWLAMKLLGQLSVILKSSSILSDVVQAAINFFELQNKLKNDDLALLLFKFQQQGIAAAVRNNAEIALYFSHQQTVQDTYGFMLDHTSNLLVNPSGSLKREADQWYLKVSDLDLMPLSHNQDLDTLVQSVAQIRLSQKI